MDTQAHDILVREGLWDAANDCPTLDGIDLAARSPFHLVQDDEADPEFWRVEDDSGGLVAYLDAWNGHVTMLRLCQALDWLVWWAADEAQVAGGVINAPFQATLTDSLSVLALADWCEERSLPDVADYLRQLVRRYEPGTPY